MAISFLQFICNCLYEARFSHLCLFKPSNQQGFLLRSVKTCQLHKSMSVLMLKKEFKLVKCYDICDELMVFWYVFFAKSWCKISRFFCNMLQDNLNDQSTIYNCLHTYQLPISKKLTWSWPRLAFNCLKSLQSVFP